MKSPSLGFLTLALLMAGCGDSPSGPLDQALAGGYIDTEESENYNRGTLYSYMDGGADLYLEYGFSSLSVRRYARGKDRYLVELYGMTSPEPAFGIYSYNRRPGTERELFSGCPAAITDVEIQCARGSYYLVCRNEDPMARSRAHLIELASQIAQRLPGDCARSGDLFSRLPAERRVAGSEVALFGPLGLNARPWLTSLGKRGFTRGSLATYAYPVGQIETLLAEYGGQREAEQAIAELKKSNQPGVAAERREEVVAVTHAPGVPREDVDSLISSLLKPPDWR